MGTGAIVFDDINCFGTEARLSDCQSISTHNCLHTEDAGVVCQPPSTAGICNIIVYMCFILHYTLLLYIDFQPVVKEISDWWVVLSATKDGWSFATMESGAQYVMTFGVLLMPMWSAGS